MQSEKWCRRPCQLNFNNPSIKFIFQSLKMKKLKTFRDVNMADLESNSFTEESDWPLRMTCFTIITLVSMLFDSLIMVEYSEIYSRENIYECIYFIIIYGLYLLTDSFTLIYIPIAKKKLKIFMFVECAIKFLLFWVQLYLHNIIKTGETFRISFYLFFSLGRMAVNL